MNTVQYALPSASALLGLHDVSYCVLESGESAKHWSSVQKILEAAHRARLARDGLFVGIGGGVVTDMCAFAASLYMRGCRLALVSTTLLGMADAAVGGKTGIDLFGIKNLAGTFYPAEHVYLPAAALTSLPPYEWKSGMAELIKTAILDDEASLHHYAAIREDFLAGTFFSPPQNTAHNTDTGGARALIESIAQAVRVKGRIVEADPKETGTERALLNLGHTFGHALEASVGLGKLSHGEAVAWGMNCACKLGIALGITPKLRAAEIIKLLEKYHYERILC
jgi:3-dehydroquinate synthase